MASRALTIIPPPAAREHGDVGEMVRLFEEADQSTQDARKLAERDRDYYDGKQWTAAEESALKKRGQPVVTYNLIKNKVNSLKGLEAQTRKDPKAFPRTPGDEGSAQAATDALRFVCDDNDWDQIRSDAFEAIIVEGTGAIMVGARDGREGIDPDITVIPWDRFWYDPHARRIDFSDAAYMGIVTWMDYDQAALRWPDRRGSLDATMESASASDTYDDRPKFQLWADPKRKRVRIIEAYYRKDGRWMACTFTKGGYLSDPEPSPYLDSDKRPSNPIHAISAYVDRDNNRYGEVRAMISAQDEVNKRHSKGLHLISTRQMRISRAAQIEASEAKRESAKPDGVFIADKDELEILETADMAAGNYQILQEAKNHLALMSSNASLQGKNEKDLSGRAILAQQQAGMVEIGALMDRLRQLSLAVYRASWERIQQYWTEPRWIRVTDDQRNPRFVGLNQPRTMLEVAQERLQGDPQAEMKLALLARDLMAHQPIEVQNNVAELDVDITIDEGIDTPTVQAEQFETLMKTLPALQGQPPEVMELIIQASSLRDKDKLIEIAKKVGAQPQIPPELQQQIEEGQQRLAQLEQENQQLKADQSTRMAAAQMDAQLAAQKAEMDAQTAQQQAQAKAASDVEIARIQAATDIEVARIKAETDAQIAAERVKVEAKKPQPAMQAA